MKRITFLVVLVFAQYCQGILTTDFIQGFETGVYVRDDERAFADYSCPRPDPSDAFGKQI